MCSKGKWSKDQLVCGSPGKKTNIFLSRIFQALYLLPFVKGGGHTRSVDDSSIDVYAVYMSPTLKQLH